MIKKDSNPDKPEKRSFFAVPRNFHNALMSLFVFAAGTYSIYSSKPPIYSQRYDITPTESPVKPYNDCPVTLNVTGPNRLFNLQVVTVDGKMPVDTVIKGSGSVELPSAPSDTNEIVRSTLPVGPKYGELTGRRVSTIIDNTTVREVVARCNRTTYLSIPSTAGTIAP